MVKTLKKLASETPEPKITKQTIETPEEVEYYIGGLHKSIKESDIYDHFEPVGEISSLKVISTPNKHKKIAFIKFTSPPDSILKLDKTEIQGKKIKIRPASARQSKSRPNIQSNIIFIGNIPYNTTEDTIGSYFQAYGDIKEVRLPRNSDGSLRDYCYIEFTDCLAATNALKSDKYVFDGRNLKVDIAESPKPLPQSITRPYRWGLEL
jgi:nucleolin